MFARLSKTLFLSLFFAILLAAFPLQSFAQSPHYGGVVDSNVPENTHTKTQIMMIETMSALLCQLIGIDPLDPKGACLSINPETQKIGYVTYPDQDPEQPRRAGGLLGFVTTMIGASYQLPVKTSDYTSYLASSFGLVKKVYGQNAEQRTGSGFQSLGFTLPLWTKIRNVTYLLFTFLFIIVGVAVMLRIKLDARTAMTIQNQIPKIIITLLLVTFSYAIAGFLVDMMWVGTYLGINIIATDQPCTGGNGADGLVRVATRELLTNPINYVTNILGEGWCRTNQRDASLMPIVQLSWEVGNYIGGVATNILFGALGADEIGGSTSCGLNPSTWGFCIQGAWFHVIRWFIGLLGTLIIVIAIIAQLFRVWFQLIKAYIYVVLYTVMAPIWIAIPLIPGVNSFGFKDWLFHMLFALSVYPVTIFLFVIAVVLANDPAINSASADTSGAFVPPLVGNPNIANNIGFILVLSIILITPEVVNMMRGVFKTQPSKYAGAIYAAMGAGSANAGKPLSATWGALNSRDNQGNARGPWAYAQDLTIGRKTKEWGEALQKKAPGLMKRWENADNPIVTGIKNAYEERYGKVLQTEDERQAITKFRNEYRAKQTPGAKDESPAQPPTSQQQRNLGDQQREEAEGTAGLTAQDIEQAVERGAEAGTQRGAEAAQREQDQANQTVQPPTTRVDINIPENADAEVTNGDEESSNQGGRTT